MFKKKYFLFIFMAILFLTGCEKIDYNRAIKLMENDKYDEAIEILRDIQGYKDSGNRIETEELYQKALVYINQNNFSKSIEILEKLENYRDSDELLKKEIEYKTSYINEKKRIDGALEIFNTKEFDDPRFANKILRRLGDYNNFKTKLREDAVILHVYSYSKKYVNNYWDSGDTVMDRRNYKDENRDEYIQILKLLSPDSEGSGYRKKDISNVMSNIQQGSQNIYEVTKNEWLAAYNNKELIGLDPVIGMTEEQVIISSWGKPEKINRTRTRMRIYEQWVYPDYRYIYLDNGLVTAIQD